jgi:hypothetical protein
MTNYHSRTLVNIISALFIFLFAYTAVNKSLEISLFKNVLARSPLIYQSWSGLVAWTIILLEWLAVFLLLLPPLRRKGLGLSLGLMTVFTFYIIIMLLTVSRLPCSCGGVLNSLSWRDHLYLNVGLTLLAGIGFFKEKKINPPRKNNIRYLLQ